jgi:anti-anti-sigma factor
MLIWKRLKIKARESDGIIILELRGEIVEGKACQQVRECVKQVLANDNRMVLLNLQHVHRIDNQGLASLVAACNSAWEQGAEPKLVVRPRTAVEQALDRLLLTVFVDVYQDEKEALEGFKQWLFTKRLHSADPTQTSPAPQEAC